MSKALENRCFRPKSAAAVFVKQQLCLSSVAAAAVTLLWAKRQSWRYSGARLQGPRFELNAPARCCG